jgi:hypothetical protein
LSITHIGVDFDNTIVCYDSLFHRVCRERSLIPADVPVSKSEVRNYLRRVGREDDWTELQGYVYGARLNEADPFPGVIAFFETCREQGIEVTIISHKTQYPYAGAKYDLHRAAQEWLALQGFFDPERIGLPPAKAFFESSKRAKLERIGQCGCTHYIDDLPEFLAEPGFPAAVRRVLFDPNSHYPDSPDYLRVNDWLAATEVLAG